MEIIEKMANMTNLTLQLMSQNTLNDATGAISRCGKGACQEGPPIQPVPGEYTNIYGGAGEKSQAEEQRKNHTQDTLGCCGLC